MEYDYKNTWRFRPDLSGPGLTGDEYFVMTHPLITGMAMQIYQERQELLSFIGKIIDRVFMRPTDIFYKGTLWGILFDGITIDCSSTEFEVEAACLEFDSGDYKEFSRFNDTSMKFSLFGNVIFIKMLSDAICD